MKPPGVLLIGPCPPPHGGVSVHVAAVRRALLASGVPCGVVNTDGDGTRGRGSKLRRLAHLLQRVARLAEGRIAHVHINGHSTRSWLLALLSGVAASSASARLLTVHSGMAPDYLRRGRGWRLALARRACRHYERVICVSPDVRQAVLGAGVDEGSLEVIPAYLPTRPLHGTLPKWLRQWMRQHRPLLSTVLSFEPEYRFDLLVDAVAELRRQRPRLGCLVMGGGRGEADARRLVRRAGLDDAMLLLGDIEHGTCLHLMSISDLFVRATARDGDAISVREALALDVPVAASDVGNRPAGARLFEADDLDSMVATLAELLRDGGEVPLAPRPAPDGRDALLDVYRELSGTTRSVVATAA